MVAEIVKTKKGQSQACGIEEIVGYEGGLVVVHDPQPDECRQAVPGSDSVDAIHEVEGVDDADGSKEHQDPTPPWKGW